MSQFPRPHRPVLQVRGGAAGGGGRPVTSAGRVPTSRRFPQWLRTIARRGRPVTSAAPPPPDARAHAASAPAPFVELPADLPLGAPPRAWLAVSAGTPCRRSS